MSRDGCVSMPYVWPERAAQMATHANTRTTQLYDRRAEGVTLDEVEPVSI
jgi:hypothetical protein